MRLVLLSLLAALIAVIAPRYAPAQPQVTVPLTYLEQSPISWSRLHFRLHSDVWSLRFSRPPSPTARMRLA